MRWSAMTLPVKRAAPESEIRRKHELECLRIAAACANLARDLENKPALQAHFSELADIWSELAETGPEAAACLKESD